MDEQKAFEAHDKEMGEVVICNRKGGVKAKRFHIEKWAEDGDGSGEITKSFG